ncbi:MAG: type II toxin-antitoxin system HicB family antitoxin [Moorea sp. SIO1G6]|uniref:type II toxin-antitoxin system HicB family antitoxin n=1 Tax=Moorena sp. SIO1G6 TaxID=2607840 RepID=UPI0013BED775|nr:type II toxin-antitoxin system HicB family antitoxin [Moorena sp. SIO1G6]NET68938.1 type II toxin-antitoxin system HicB family antitoxin [Moorena sp. SIO1G6]
MSREFNVIIERDADGYFVAYVPTLKGCHTQGKSLDELMERIREAIGRRPRYANTLCFKFEENVEDSLHFVISLSFCILPFSSISVFRTQIQKR